eukprot:1186377-Prorocentrum_minimum.AAC.5
MAEAEVNKDQLIRDLEAKVGALAKERDDLQGDVENLCMANASGSVAEQAKAAQQALQRKWRADVDAVRHERDDLSQKLVLEKTRHKQVGRASIPSASEQILTSESNSCHNITRWCSQKCKWRFKRLFTASAICEYDSAVHSLERKKFTPPLSREGGLRGSPCQYNVL